MKTPVFFIGEKLSRATRQWLQKQHIQFIEQPFIRIAYKKPVISFFETMANKPKQWIISSVYAGHWLVRFKEQIKMTPDDRIYCWSEMQAETVQNLGLPVEVTSYSNAAELAERVVDQNNGQSVLFLHGDKLHSDISTLLKSLPIQYTEIEVYRNTPIEKFVSGIFDAYLFFSPSGIDGFKASGNFPHPASLILTNENSTARDAWRFFTNTVYLSPEQEELPFVQYSVNRWMEENSKRNIKENE